MKKLTPEQSLDLAQAVLAVVENAPAMTHEDIEQPLRQLAEDKELKAGQVFGLLREAVTAQRVSPPLVESMHILGKDECVARLRKAIIILENLVKNGANNE